jgi:hypothetical protein
VVANGESEVNLPHRVGGDVRGVDHPTSQEEPNGYPAGRKDPRLWLHETLES